MSDSMERSASFDVEAQQSLLTETRGLLCDEDDDHNNEHPAAATIRGGGVDMRALFRRVILLLRSTEYFKLGARNYNPTIPPPPAPQGRLETCTCVLGEKWTSVGSFADWWMMICKLKKEGVNEDRAELSVAIIWNIWKARNIWVFQKIWKNESDIVRAVVAEWIEFKEVNMLEKKESEPPEEDLRMSEVWTHDDRQNQISREEELGHHLLSVSYFFPKKNGDGVGLGCWMKAEDEGNQRAWCSFRGDCTSPVEATLLEVRHALVRTTLLNWENIIILIDNKAMTEALNAKKHFRLSFLTISEDIYLFVSAFNSCKFCCTSFPNEHLSSRLALFAASREISQEWQFPFPLGDFCSP